MSVVIASTVHFADWPYASDATFEVRAKSNRDWVSAEGELVLSGMSRVVGTGTITALRPTLPAITLPSTSAGLDDQTAKWTVTLHRVGKSQPVTTVLADFPLPVSFEPSTNWAAIKINKNGKQPLRDTSVYTKTETNNLVSQQIGVAVGSFNDASDLVKGRAKLSIAPVLASNPIAVGNNDPRVLDISNYASFAAMITAIGSTQTTFNVHGNINVSANASVPTNITLRFLQGGRLTLTTGVTLTILGPIEADPVKIFYNALSGQGTVSFGTNLLQRTLWFEWWGAVGQQSDTGLNNAPALNAALAALPNGCTLRFGSIQRYYVTQPVSFTHKFQVSIIGNDSDEGYADPGTQPWIVYTGATQGITLFTASNVYASTFRGFGLYGFADAGAGKAATNFYLTFTAGGFPGLTTHCIIRAMTIHAGANNDRADWIGLNINNANGQNNEQHVVENCLFVDWAGGDHGTDVRSNLGIGILVGHPQVKHVIIQRNTFINLKNSVYASSNFRAIENIHTNITTVYWFQYQIEATLIRGDDVEHIYRYIDGIESHGTVILTGNRVAGIKNTLGAGMTEPEAVLNLHFGAEHVLIGCFFNTDTNDGNIPYLFGVIGAAGPPVLSIYNGRIDGSGTMDAVAAGLSLFYATVESGGRLTKFGGSAFGVGDDFLRAPPTYNSIRRLIGLKGPSTTAPGIVDDYIIADNVIGIGGLYMPNAVSATVFGTPGATARTFTLIARDVWGRRTLSYATSANKGVRVSNGAVTLNATDKIRLTWPAQPFVTDYQVYELDPDDADKWRLVDTVTPSGTLTETYDVIANPVGAFTASKPLYSEGSVIKFRGQTIYPHEVAFASADATPSVAIGNDFVTANAGATTITNFDDATTGQEIRIRINDATTTIQNNANIVTGTGADIATANGAVYKFMRRGGAWRRIL